MVIKRVVLQRHKQLLWAVAVLRAQVVHFCMAAVVSAQEAGYLRQRVAVEHCSKASAGLTGSTSEGAGKKVARSKHVALTRNLGTGHNAVWVATQQVTSL